MELKGHTIGFKGEYSATVLKADGTVKEFLNEEKTLRSGDVIKNLLLDNFFQRLISTTTPLWNTSIRCGTGSTPVSVEQNSLSNQIVISGGSWPIGDTSRPLGVLSGGTIEAIQSSTFTFSIGQIVGNISEFGVNFAGESASSDTLVHSRALVVDNLGNPTTITVGASEQLVINYTLRMETSASDSVYTGVYNLNGTPINVEITSRWHIIGRLMNYTQNPGHNFQAYSGDLNAIGVDPTGMLSQGQSDSTSNAFNVSGGKETTYVFSTSVANTVNGITVLANQSSGEGFIKFGFNPPLPKNSDRTMSITIRQTFGRLP